MGAGLCSTVWKGVKLGEVQTTEGLRTKQPFRKHIQSHSDWTKQVRQAGSLEGSKQ